MSANVIDFPQSASGCEVCPSARICVAHGYNGDEQGAAFRCATPLKRGQHAFRQGDALEYLYILRSGSARSYFDSSDGLEQVVGFHYPGDLLGFDGLGDGAYRTSVVALETAALCRIPFALEALPANVSPGLWAAVTRAGARQLDEQHNHALLLGQKSASARFASFLLKLSGAFAARGCSRTEFNLSMPRQDIANYLSLAVETISRQFGDLQAVGVLDVDRRHVRISSLEGLRAIATEGSAAVRQAN